MEAIKFDRERYIRESKDPNYVRAQMAFERSESEKAFELFAQVYRTGSVLATARLGILYYNGYGCGQSFEEALRLFCEGMEKGCPLCADWAAECYQLGLGVPKDEERAKEIVDGSWEALRTMAGEPDADALYCCGQRLMYGKFIETDEGAALECQRRAMELGHFSAAAEVAKAYLFGRGVEVDEKKGIEILERYSDRYHRVIRGLLGMAYLVGLGGREPDYVLALEHLLVAAECGDASSQRTAGFLLTGVCGDIPADYPRAILWLEKAVKAGEAEAAVYLARIYSSDEIWEWDEEKVAGYLDYAEKRQAQRKADGEVEDFDADIHRRMADLYYGLFSTEGLYQDEEWVKQRAFDHYCRALSLGLEDVAYDVTWMYFWEDCESPFLEWSAEELLELLKRQEARSKDPRTALFLARTYAMGFRIQPDHVKAKEWYEVAAEKGDESAAYVLEGCPDDDEENFPEEADAYD